MRAVAVVDGAERAVRRRRCRRSPSATPGARDVGQLAFARDDAALADLGDRARRRAGRAAIGCPGRSAWIGGKPPCGSSHLARRVPAALRATRPSTTRPLCGNVDEELLPGRARRARRDRAARDHRRRTARRLQRPVPPSWSGDGMSTRSAMRPTATRFRSVRATTNLQCLQTCARRPAKRKVIGAPQSGTPPDGRTGCSRRRILTRTVSRAVREVVARVAPAPARPSCYEAWPHVAAAQAGVSPSRSWASVFVIATSGLVYELVDGDARRATCSATRSRSSASSSGSTSSRWASARGSRSSSRTGCSSASSRSSSALALAGGLSAPLLFKVYTSVGAVPRGALRLRAAHRHARRPRDPAAHPAAQVLGRPEGARRARPHARLRRRARREPALPDAAPAAPRRAPDEHLLRRA